MAQDMNRAALVIGLVVAVAALAVRLPGLTVRPPWLDEMYTLFALSRGWGDMVAERMLQGHSPVWFLIMKALPLPPHDAVALRALASACDAAAAGVLAWAVARHVGLAAGLAGGLLIAASAVHVQWALNARPYGFLMLALAIGVAGAMDLVRAGGAPAPRWALRAHALGFACAVVTLSAGVLAFLAVALAPMAVSRLRRNAAFRRTWLRASALPLTAVVLMAAFVSLPHAADQAGSYWAERYNTFGRASLERLALGLATGETAAYPDPRLPGGPLHGARGGLALALPILALWGLWRLRGSAAGIVLGGLCIGLGGTLVLISLHTSLLIPRYFLPAWSAGLILAAAALVAPPLRPVRGAAAAACVALTAAFGAAQSTSQVAPDPPGASEAATTILRLSGDGRPRAWVEPSLHNAIMSEALAGILHDPARAKPRLPRADPNHLAILLTRTHGFERARGHPSILIVTPRTWGQVHAPRLPVPDCILDLTGLIVAIWGTGPCPD